MNIPAIGGVQGAFPAAKRISGTDKADAVGFGSSIGKALEELDQLHGTADGFAAEAATGELESVTDYLVAATEAQLATQVTVAVRNRAVEAFNDIMRMQV